MDQDKLPAEARKMGGECSSKVPAAPVGQTGGCLEAGAAGQDPCVIGLVCFHFSGPRFSENQDS